MQSCERYCETDALHACRDAAGRDFSVNSLAVDPVKMLLHDCNGGLHALRQFRVASASIPTASLTSDPIRCVRCALTLLKH